MLPAGPPAWELSLVGTAGVIGLLPGDEDPGALTLYTRGAPPRSYAATENAALARQAEAFVAAVRGEGQVRNPAADAVRDIELCQLIAPSAAGGGAPQHPDADTDRGDR